MKPRQQNTVNSASGPNAVLFDVEFVDMLVDVLKHDKAPGNHHMWETEQQTGHPVCAWCGYCEGGC